MTAPRLILATDLDGTFLGGSEAQRRRLYREISSRPDALLVFVTGRDLDFIRALIAEPGMPRPHYIIGDVGTTVVDGSDFAPVSPVQDEIARRWNGAGRRVIDMLADEPGLRLQPTPFRYRVDCLLSAETFLDVLPRGVAKGPTLLRLLETLGLPADRVLVAGDTLNDLSLFATGLKGVAVGNSEPKLIDAIAGYDWVFRSAQPGAAGISEALGHFGLEGTASP